MPSLDDAPTGTRLEYLFAKAVGYELIGSEHGPFAIPSKDGKTIAVFGSKKAVKYASFTDRCSNIPLEIAMSLGVSLRMKDGLVVCEIGQTVSTGSDLMEATLRALVAHFSSQGTDD